MTRYLSLFLLLALTACADDPLSVTVREVDGEGLTDGRADFANAEWRTHAAPTEVQLLETHGDLDLEIVYRVQPGTEATLRLQDRYSVPLPTENLTPGVWQTFETTFKAPSGDDPALLVSNYLNGNLQAYQTELQSKQPTAGPLRLEVTEGEVEIANLRRVDRAGHSSYLTSDGEVVLNMPLLRYAYYEFAPKTFTHNSWGTAEPKKTGFINRYDVNRLKEQNGNHAFRFTGQLDIPKAGKYTFTSESATDTRVYIDDQLVLEKEGVGWLEEAEGKIELSQGTHDFRLDYIQNGGWGHLELSYVAPDGSTGHLNDLDDGTPIATPKSAAQNVIETDNEPYLLRGFLLFPNPKVYEPSEKRTHALSVGESNGPHYSVDLQNGSLLQFWRGGFLDVHEMWDGRGEPQTAEPLGNALSFDGRPQWQVDASGDEAPIHLRHELDETGRPTFVYTVGGGEVTDRIVPDGQGLNRTLANLSEQTLETVLASARAISKTAPGRFELQNPGVNLEVIAGSGGLILEKSPAGQRLLSRVNPGEAVTYTLNW